MRLWLIVLIIAVSLSSIPLLTTPTGTYMRSALSLAQRSITKRIAFPLHRSSVVPALQHSTTATHQSATPTATMTDALPQQTQSPMPVLEKAGPADPKKAEELPKLSADEFRVYNRLAVMMDAYVS